MEYLSYIPVVISVGTGLVAFVKAIKENGAVLSEVEINELKGDVKNDFMKCTALVGFAKVINESRATFSELKEKLLRRSRIVINEFEGGVKNELYEAAEIYLGNNLPPQKCKIKVSMTKKEKEEEENSIKVELEPNKKVKYYYEGHKFKWILLQFPKDCHSIHKSEGKSFNLICRKKDCHFVLHTYLPHIIKEGKYPKHI